MTRLLLDRGLAHIDQQLLQLGVLVDTALEKSLVVLEHGTAEVAREVHRIEPVIDSMRDAIEEQALSLLRMQQPLGVRDIRYLTAARAVAGRLERVGDGANGIVKMACALPFTLSVVRERFSQQRIQSEKEIISEIAIVQALCEMGQEVRQGLQKAVQVFVAHDVANAVHLMQEDDVVDVRYHMVRHDLMALLKGSSAIEALRADEHMLIRATYLLWIAHKLERASDHCGHICKRTIFLEDGEWEQEEPSLDE